MLYKSTYNSPLGKITLASDGKNLIGLWIEGQKYFLSSIKSELKEQSDLEIFTKTTNWLDRYFAGENPKLAELQLAPNGTTFQKAVWEFLCKIPYGQTSTYGKIAQQIAKQFGKEKMSAQAVGGAVGHNPISIIIPCHRVIGSNGNLTGYAGGIDKKTKLLKLEKAI